MKKSELFVEEMKKKVLAYVPSDYADGITVMKEYEKNVTLYYCMA